MAIKKSELETPLKNIVGTKEHRAKWCIKLQTCLNFTKKQALQVYQESLDNRHKFGGFQKAIFAFAGNLDGVNDAIGGKFSRSNVKFK